MRLAGALLAAALLAGCGGGADVADPTAPPTGPLTALSECGAPPAPADLPDVEGVALPDGAVVTSVTPQGPLVNVTAEVPTTPVNIRLAYEARRDLQLLTAEDEVFEAELLVSDGTHRTYVKASAVCATGSTLLAVVAPEGETGLPTPAGQPGAVATASP